MNTKIKIIFTYVFLIFIIGMLYIWFRGNIYRNYYIQNIIKISNLIYNNYEKLADAHTKGIPAAELDKFVRTVQHNYQHVAHFAIFNKKNGALLKEIRHNTYMAPQQLYDHYMQDLSLNTYAPHFDKNYQFESYKKDNENHKFYIFYKPVNNYRVFITFPYSFDIITKVKIAMEVTLIAISALILTILIFINIGKVKNREKKSVKRKRTQKTTVKIYEKAPEPIIDTTISNKKPAKHTITPIKSNHATDPNDRLDLQTLQLFKLISKHFKPDSVSLYILTEKNALNKRYTVKENTFVKINSKKLDAIHLDSNVGKELQNGRTMILDNSKKILFPLLHDNDLVGMFTILRARRFSGEEITRLKEQAVDLSRYVSRMLEKNKNPDILQHKNTTTGQSIQTHESRNREGLEHAVATLIGADENFSLLLVSLLEKPDSISKQQYALIRKVIQPVILKNIQTDKEIYTIDTFLAILIPNSDRDSSVVIADKLTRILSKYKMKITKNFSVKLSPKISITTDNTTGESEDIIKTALNEINNVIQTGQAM